MTTIAIPKPRRDSGMEGMVAKWYAANTAEMMNQYVDLARRIAAELPADSSVLEVAPGPGYFAIELAKRGNFAITGLDLSHTFVKLARRRAADEGVKVDFRQGSASSMPFQDGSFDFLLCRAAFKNFAHPVEALCEMYRVLKLEGRGLIIDLRGNASPDEICREIDGMGLTAFNRFMTKQAFKSMLLKRAYRKEQFEQMLAQTRFSRAEVHEAGLGLEVSLAK